jgi:hypothetical protein
MADKKLTISSVFNAAGAKEASAAFKGLKKEAEGLGKALEKLTQTPRGQAFFAKAIVQNTTGMKKLKGVTEDTAKVMKDLLGRSMEDEKKKLDSVNTALSKYNDLYKKRQQRLASARAMGDTQGAQGTQSAINRLQGKIAGKTGEQQDIMNVLDQLQNPAAQAKIAKIAGIVGAVGAAMSAGSAIAGVYQQAKTNDLVNQAAVTSLASTNTQQMMAGNFQQMMAMSDPEAMKRVSAAGGTGAIWSRELLGLGGKLLGGAAAGAGAGALGGAFFGGIGALPGAIGGGILGAGGALINESSRIWDLTHGGAEKEAAQSQQTAIQSEMDKNAYGNMLLDRIKQDAPGMVSAARRGTGMGFVHRATGMGIGLGFGGAESAGLARSLADQMGAQGADMNLETFFQLQKGAKTTGGNIANIGSEAAGRLLGGVSYGAEGREGAGQASIDFLAKAFSKGLKDSQMAEALSQSMTESLLGTGSGRGSAYDRVSAGFAGYAGVYSDANGGKQMTRADMNDLQRGVAGGENLFTGKLGGAFAAKNQAIARDIITKGGMGNGPNAEFLVSALSGMSMQDMMRGGNAGLEAMLGGGKAGKDKMNDIVGQFSKRANQSQMDLLFPTNAFGIKSAFDAAGGDMAAAFKSMDPNQRKAVAEAIHQRAPGSGLDFMSGQALENFAIAGAGGMRKGSKVTGTSDRGSSIELKAMTDVASMEAQVRSRALSPEGLQAMNKAMDATTIGFTSMLDILKLVPGSLKELDLQAQITANTFAMMNAGKTQKEIQAANLAIIQAAANAANKPKEKQGPGANSVKTGSVFHTAEEDLKAGIR